MEDRVSTNAENVDEKKRAVTKAEKAEEERAVTKAEKANTRVKKDQQDAENAHEANKTEKDAEKGWDLISIYKYAHEFSSSSSSIDVTNKW
eukprot:6646746-Heterocapsa_arctica.AAC.1